MLGLVFTEFMDMVEERYSIEMVDDLIDESDLPSQGAYTAVGRYPAQEMLTLVQSLSTRTGIPVRELVRAFGHHLMARFTTSYPGFFESRNGAFDFLQSIDNHIHVEVKKLYDNAQPPRIDARRIDDSTLVIDYRSHRPLADLAEGLIEGAIDHFGEKVDISRESLASEQGCHERFTLLKQA